MVSIEGVKFQYDAAGPVLSFPDFSCAQGDRMLLLGNSGAGKTTLLHLLCGLLTPTSGALTVGSKSLHTSTDRELDRWRGTEVGVIFQQAHFVQSLTVRENLALPHQLTTGRIPEDLEAKMDDMLDRLGIGHRAGARPHELSVGEQQRASIARALLHKPKVVFADEPTSALDDGSAAAVMDILDREAADATLVVVTHDQRLKDRYATCVTLNPQRP